jgi:alanyl-tRNA synthetase
VAVLQNKNSNYRTDLLWPLIQKTQELTGQTDEERELNFTSYRVIADHARAAAFLIADGVVPGNLGRNYVTRMIIRRAFRFGGKIGLQERFLAPVALVVIENYSEAYPELLRNQEIILKEITREEEQFQRTLEKATGQLENLLHDLEDKDKQILPGEAAANLYTTYGMPLEITRDIAQERGLDVDEPGFQQAMDEHRMASGAGKSMGPLGGEDVDVYRDILKNLQEEGKIGDEGVIYNPYGEIEFKGELLALVRENQPIERASPGDQVEVLLPLTHFYVEAGGQVSDTGMIRGENWVIHVSNMRKPAAGIVAHLGDVVEGEPKVGDAITAQVDPQRRKDIMRNHTATHLLHAALDNVLGRNARQAGSLVAPDRLRFDFTHPEALSKEELERIEAEVNKRVLEDHPLNISYKPLQQAVDEGARALFGEKYEATVRTITMDDFSYELCGGTHCNSTGEIGVFLITSEGSAAAGIRRIEAVTGREAYRRIRKQFSVLDQTAAILSTTPTKVPDKTVSLQEELSESQKQIIELRQHLANAQFDQYLNRTEAINGINVLCASFQDADANTLRQMADRFRQHYPEHGIAVLASVVDNRPIIIAAVTQDLVDRGIKAGDLVKEVAQPLGGGGGGRPTLAQAGGRDAHKLQEALESVSEWVKNKLK